jgi:acyl-CoA synthetase (AMP-forming)/AMP-acid ligase II
MAIIDFFDRGWRLAPDAPAYRQGERTYTFTEVGNLTCQVAHSLINSGITPGSHGAVWAGNDVTAWICTLGLWRANMAWIPIASRNTTEQNVDLLVTFDCDVLFFQEEQAADLATYGDRLARVKLFVCIDGEAPGLERAVSLHTWIENAPTSAPDIPNRLDDVVMISATGGTTGAPKGVMNTHRSLQTFCAHYLMSTPYEPTDQVVNLAAAPMTHTAGVLSLPATSRGGCVVVLPVPEPTTLLDTITSARVTELFLPPTVIYRLIEVASTRPPSDFESLKYFLYGAAPMSLDRLKQALKVFGPCMMGGYGQTEAPASISFLTPREHFTPAGLASDDRLSSVGRPNPLIRVSIRGDDDQELDTGCTGEICVRGDLVMKGYYKADALTEEAVVGEWLHTGDLGHLDSSGYLHITDRKKDMIISGGFNVYPSEVEQVLWAHPDVHDCAVIGVPHPDWGEAVTAVVEPQEGASVDPAELIALCRAKLGPVRSPKTVEIVASLPRSSAGKVLKKDLRAQFDADTA